MVMAIPRCNSVPQIDQVRKLGFRNDYLELTSMKCVWMMAQKKKMQFQNVGSQPQVVG